MLSSRRIAQLGLSAACLTLVTSITVLVAGSNDPTRNTNPRSMTASSHVDPLATGQLSLSQTIVSSKQ